MNLQIVTAVVADGVYESRTTRSAIASSTHDVEAASVAKPRREAEAQCPWANKQMLCHGEKKDPREGLMLQDECNATQDLNLRYVASSFYKAPRASPEVHGRFYNVRM